MSLRELDRASVLRAIQEFDALGREPFLTKYGFAHSKGYFLIHEGRWYDSKAIAGAAHGYATGVPLKNNEFSGGESTVQRVMEPLGFKIEAPGKRVGVPLFRDDGTEINAHFYVDWDDINDSVVLESRGGRKGTPGARNVDYAEGLKLVLERLGRRRFILTTALLDTRETAHLDLAERLLKIDGVGWESDPERSHWVDLASADPEVMRLRIMRAQRTNSTRRIRLVIRPRDERLSEVQIDTEELQAFLQHGGTALETAVEDVVDAASEPLVETRTEGGVRVVATKKYERNAGLRRLALQLHGTVCRVCDFDFEKVYGEIGRGYIQIHHVVPVSEGEREVDPSTDLVPLCANCHVMIHAKPGLTLSVDGLRSRMRGR